MLSILLGLAIFTTPVLVVGYLIHEENKKPKEEIINKRHIEIEDVYEIEILEELIDDLETEIECLLEDEDEDYYIVDDTIYKYKPIDDEDDFIRKLTNEEMNKIYELRRMKLKLKELRIKNN